MAKKAAPPKQKPQESPTSDAKQLLSVVLQEPTDSTRQLIKETLGLARDFMEDLLPAPLKGSSDRLIKRALVTFAKNPKLRDCSADSFCRSVIQAAEFGLPIDGRLGHVVPYWNSERKCLEAQFQPDYKGLCVVARRNGTIKDAYARLVWIGEVFRCGTRNGEDFLEHEENPELWGTKLLGAYAVLVFRDGHWRYEFMSADDLKRIQSRTKSKDRSGRIVGPWVTDPGEMYKKTVLRRALKTYCDDEDLSRLMAVDDGDGAQPEPETPDYRVRGPARDLSFDSADVTNDDSGLTGEYSPPPEKGPEMAPDAFGGAGSTQDTIDFDTAADARNGAGKTGNPGGDGEPPAEFSKDFKNYAEAIQGADFPGVLESIRQSLVHQKDRWDPWEQSNLIAAIDNKLSKIGRSE